MAQRSKFQTSPTQGFWSSVVDFQVSAVSGCFFFTWVTIQTYKKLMYPPCGICHIPISQNPHIPVSLYPHILISLPPRKIYPIIKFIIYIYNYILIYQLKNKLCSWTKTPGEFEIPSKEREQLIGHIWFMFAVVIMCYLSGSLHEYLRVYIYICMYIYVCICIYIYV
jgi:hypothetical protein